MKKSNLFTITIILVVVTSCFTENKIKALSLNPKLISNSIQPKKDIKPLKKKVAIKNKNHLSLKEVIALALMRSNTNKENFAQVVVSELNIRKSRSAFLPKISFSTSQKRIQEYSDQIFFNSLDDSRNAFALRTDWLLFDGFGKEISFLQSKKLKKIAYLNIDLYQRQLTHAVIKKYFYGVILIKQIAQKEKDILFEKESLEIAQRKFDAELVSRSDILNFKMRSLDVDSQILELQNNWKTLLSELAALCSVEVSDLEKLKYFKFDSKPKDFNLLSLNEYTKIALENREELKIKDLKIKIASQNTKLEKSKFSPKVSLFHEYNGSDKNNLIGFNKIRDTSSIGVQFQLNLFNGLADHSNYIESKVKEKIENFRKNDEVLKIKSEISSLYYQITKLNKMLKLNKIISEIAENKRNITKKEYIAGKADVLKLNDAQNQYSSAMTVYQISVVKYSQAYEELQTLIK